ncbi:hypothetical protein XPA_005754 [Xanthoria parietina]
MSSATPHLSIFEYFSLSLVLVESLWSAALVLLKTPLRRDKGHRDLTTQIAFAKAKIQNEKLSARQSQWLNPPTEEVYLKLAEAQRFPPNTVALAHNTKAHWIGSSGADSIMVFFHGGGYVKPATTQLDLLWNIKKSMPQTFSICLMSYTLAPSAQYPFQLRQAVLLLKYLIVDQGKDAKRMILCGDSAGGNLILGLLSHLQHPHPSIPALTVPEPFLGAALVSPWGEFSTSAPSFTRNEENDSINGAILRRWATYFMDGAPADNYNQPFLAPGDWWKGLNGVIQALLITAGTDEVLLDGIAEFVTTIKTGFPSTTTFFAPREFHDQPFMESLDDNDERCQQGKVLKAWLRARMSLVS